MKYSLIAFLLLSTMNSAAEKQSLSLSNGQAKQWLYLNEINPAIIDGKLHIADRVYEAENGKLFANSDGTIFALQSISHQNKSGKITLSFFESSGKQIGQFHETLNWDRPVPRFVFAGDQHSMYRIALSRVISKVNFRGDVVAEYTLPGILPGSETNIISRVDAAGRLYVAVVSPHADDFGMDWQSQIFRLENGSFEQLFRLKKALIAFNVSEDGTLLACSVFEQQEAGKPTVKQSLLVNRSGEILATLELPFSNGYFSDNHILLMDRYRVALIERQTGRERWRSPKNEPGFINLAALLLKSGQIVVQSGRISDAARQSGNSWSYQPVRLSVFNFAGKLLEENTLKDVQVFEPSLAPAEDGRSVFFGHSKGWTVFRGNND